MSDAAATYRPAVVILSLMILASAGAGPLPDPTRPAVGLALPAAAAQPAEELLTWNLTAIRISPTDRTAIINGQLVKVGDVVGRGIVREITRDGVVLDYNRKKLVVQLIPYKVKASPSKTD